MALEDFTTYTAGGADIADVTITAFKCDVDCTEHDEAWVYDDKGAGHFGNSFEHHFQLTIRASGTDCYVMAAWAVANTIGEGTQGWLDNDREAVAISPDQSGDTRYIELREFEDGDLDYTFGVFTPSYDEALYLKVIRSGAQGKTITCYVYTGSIGGVLKDTIVIALTDADQGYRYIYAVNTRDEAGGEDVQMEYDVEDLDLNEGAPPAGAARRLVGGGLAHSSPLLGGLV